MAAAVASAAPITLVANTLDQSSGETSISFPRWPTPLA